MISTLNHSLRVSSCVVCLRDDKVLLSRWVDPADADHKHWSFPGGGLEPGEDPFDAAIREAEEETGLAVEIDALLGMHTRVTPAPLSRGDGAVFHSLRVFYIGRVVGGRLRNEVGGSSDLAAWIDLAQVARLPRDERVDIGLALARERPASGRLRQ